MSQKEQVLESMSLSLEVAGYVLDRIKAHDFNLVNKLLAQMNQLLISINDALSEDPTISEVKNEYLINALASLKAVSKLNFGRSEKFQMKLEFELIPLLRGMYKAMYYYSKVTDDTTYLESVAPKMDINPYIEESEKRGHYKYDLSIVVLAFNQLAYTQKCIESLMTNVPSNLNYELILINNGSTDETKAYFESLHVTKQIDLEVNGICRTIFRYSVEGRYVLFVSNDILVTDNAIINMVECIESDDRIIKVVPTTSNVSNHQTIPVQYKDIDSMYEFAKVNNILDPNRWEERTRLIDPIHLHRSVDYCSSFGFFESLLPFVRLKAFPDDAFGAWARRSGKKQILAKDAFCYHFGSVTYKETNTTDRFTEGRRIFTELVGYDPWGKGFCYDMGLVALMNHLGLVGESVLGINVGIGANALKCRELLKEKNVQGKSILLNILSDEVTYQDDHRGLGDQFYSVSDIKMFDYTTLEKYDVVILEELIENHEDMEDLVARLSSCLSETGILVILSEQKRSHYVTLDGYRIINAKSEMYKGYDWVVYTRA